MAAGLELLETLLLIAEELALELETARELLEAEEMLAIVLLFAELLTLLEITVALVTALDDCSEAALAGATITLELEIASALLELATASRLLEREMLLTALELGGGLAPGI